MQALKALACGLHTMESLPAGEGCTYLGFWLCSTSSLAVPAGPQRLPSHPHMVFMSPEWLKSCIEPNQLVHATGCDM